jgi:hypothetical protein
MKRLELLGMKRLKLLAVFLMLSGMSSAALAEWVRIYGNDQLNAYADAASIRKKGNITKVIALFDFRDERVLKDGMPYQSIVRETEFNCKQNQQRMVSFAIYSAKMAKGKIVESGDEAQDWKTVSREQVARDMKKYVCSRD